jgi:hypothetical protein
LRIRIEVAGETECAWTQIQQAAISPHDDTVRPVETNSSAWCANECVQCTNGAHRVKFIVPPNNVIEGYLGAHTSDRSVQKKSRSRRSPKAKADRPYY